MSRQELEAKILKHLHKANRGKTTKNKLEKLDELLEILQTMSASLPPEQHPSNPKDVNRELLEQYRELCYIHKLKFQMDALLSDMKQGLKAIEKSTESFTLEQFDCLLQQLYVILDIDAGHPEVPILLDALTRGFPQYAEQSSFTKTYITLAPCQTSTMSIEVECPLEDVQKSSTLEAIYTTNKVKVTTQPDTRDASDAICRLRFSQEQLTTFETFHEELHTKPSYRIFVNTHPVEEKAFTAWFNCYKRSLHANTPQYCYGASPLTFNFFGCHKLYMPDVAKHKDLCWFRFGTLDRKSGIFLVDRQHIAEQIRTHLKSCGFCPALNQNKLNIGIGLLPKYINPECDHRWKYLYHDGERVGVIPSGNDIAMSLQPQEAEKIDLTTVIEIGQTPSIDTILRYLASENTADLSEKKYQNISRCLNCGATYRPHTMACSKCKVDFEKYAVRNPEAALKELTYFCPLEMPAAENQETITPEPSRIEKESGAVSFEQLWNDPKVQEILSPQPDPLETPLDLQPVPQDIISEEEAIDERHEQELPPTISDEYKEERPLRDHSGSTPRGRFDLHGKLRSLVSKKYRERKAIEHAFLESTPQDFPVARSSEKPVPGESADHQQASSRSHALEKLLAHPEPPGESEPPQPRQQHVDSDLHNAVKQLRPRQKSELSKRGVVRVIYHATIDKDICPLCEHLDGMVMDPDDPATDIFSPPLFPGCTCSREYVLKTEKPSNWPQVTFKFPPKELLSYLQKE